MNRKKLNELQQRRKDLVDIYTSMELYNKAFRVKNCMTNAKYREDSTEDNIKIERAWFCGDRWCPVCIWRKSLASSAEMYNLNTEIISETDTEYCYRMVTLTVPNISKEELSATIEKMGTAWGKIIRRKTFKDSIKGWVKVLDITYNAETDTYHPHYHVATCHVASYGHNQGHYITHNTWLQWWREAMEDPTITQVHDGRWDSPAHAVGYAMIPANDDSDELLTEEIMSVLVPALKGKRRIVPGGIYRKKNQSP